MLQQRALGAHPSYGPTFCHPGSQAINKLVIDPSSQNKLDAFWCQLEVRISFSFSLQIFKGT